ncbi:hypothetical protein ACO0LC_29065, partial [Undibacterium sp. JH2W]|uniref:hypothetical protein n=1 Tax=Undibacterium sp. JH2W TaxID=3413037 RepID=UPI003BF33FA1
PIQVSPLLPAIPGYIFFSVSLFLLIVYFNKQECPKKSGYLRVPSIPIPLQRVISKYGKSEKSGFRDDNFQPYLSWAKKGIYATLSDDEKFVIDIQFSPTEEERNIAFSKKK